MNDIKPIYESGWDEDANGKRWEDYETILCPDGYRIDMVNLVEEIERAKAALTHLAPMFGGLIHKLYTIYTFKVSTMATDGSHLFINPQFADKELDFTGKVFVLAHEVMHCLLNHLRRARVAGHNDARLSNVAADAETNITLVDIGLFKDSTIKNLKGIYDPKYKNWGYEKIYDDIKPDTGKSMDNSSESSKAKQNEGEQLGNNTKSYSDDYKAGWKQAMEDYKAGKLKL